MILTGVFIAAKAPVPAYLHRLKDRKEFDELARSTDFPYPLPHIFFLIDRRHGNAVYYANSKRYGSHRAFANGVYLSLEKGQKFFQDNYLRADRRFYMGTLGFQTPIKKWTYEFWEGDQIDGAGLQTVEKAIKSSFFDDVAFKPNSLRQEEVSEGIPKLFANDIVKPGPYAPITLGTAIGRVHIVGRFDDKAVVKPDEIVVLSEAPVYLPPVAGIVTTLPASPLSHISLRSKSLGIPDAYIENADKLFARFDGQVVKLVTKPDQYLIGKPDAKDLATYVKRESKIRTLLTPHADLVVTKIADLVEQRKVMSSIYGSKSANLGEMMSAHVQEAQIPDGFSLPFAAYRSFVVSNGLDKKISGLLKDPKLREDPVYRKSQLEQLRQAFLNGTVDPVLASQVLQKAHVDFAGEGLFVRSSTNSEDLPNFNGAGLYSTFPNARTDDQILHAIKFVWSSVWNLEAFDARERAGIDHEKVFMAVLLQRGINADCAGVMVTGNPFDTGDRDSCYISATKGLGIKVVEGIKVPEQLLLHYESGGIQVLTRSSEDALLTFDKNGGLKELPVEGTRSVLTDDLAQRLGRVARRIQTLFGGQEQDIEWTVMNGKIYVVQARPYLREP